MLANPIPTYKAAISRNIRRLRTPKWRRDISVWLDRHVAPALHSEGEGRVEAVLEQVAERLTPVLAALDRGAAVLDERVFAGQFYHALAPLTFGEDIMERGAKIRAYCDIGATLAVFDAILPEIASELGLDEVEVATRLGTSAEGRREALVFAGRRLLASGRHEEAAVFARRSLDMMTSCPHSQALLMGALRARRDAGGSLTEAEENGLADLSGRFCPRPFEVLVSGQGVGWNERLGKTKQVMGSTYACDCAAWLPFVTGNLLEGESPDAVWNSPGMQEVRRSVLDGDYSYCSRTSCPAIVNKALPLREEVTTPRLRRIIDQNETVVDDGPRIVAFGHDSSCNLACPTCRHEVIMANREEAEQLERGRDQVILPMLRNSRVSVQMTSWGDPFASRHYRSILEALKNPEYNGVRLFLLTNGIGLTAHTWAAMPHLKDKIVELRVSVDAASKDVYEKVRRPGRWEVILENLEVMGSLERAGTFVRNRAAGDTPAVRTDLNVVMEEPYTFVIAFVVQRENFRDMPAFVRLGEALGAGVVFQKYYSFGHEAPAIYAAKDVTSSLHPDHLEFQAILHDEVMQSPNVSHAFLRQLETRSA
jgi:MoaA/NifB/PqqE/SkfB family radical SAM enzyme